MATKATSLAKKSENNAPSGDSRVLDDHATLNAINQILQRSDSLEIAALNSLEVILGKKKVLGSFIAKIDSAARTLQVTHKSDRAPDLTSSISNETIALELLKAYPQLPDWPLRLDLPMAQLASGIVTFWVKRIDESSEERGLNFILIAFAEPTELPCGDIHALEVASSVLRHKISLGDFAPRRKKDPLENSSRYRLSDRQITIAKMILDGLTNKEIAQELSLSAATIRYECVRLYERLGAKNRASAAAILQNLFSEDQIISRSR